jgi:choline dehydrogenase-like flavoprotein
MLLDARTLAGKPILDADICIVGAGPAGLSLATELVDWPGTIVVVESGASEASPEAQSLNAATVEGDPYGGLERSRHRQIGGTARLWNTPLRGVSGAKFVPLDPVDFRGANGRPAWPLAYADLEPYYRRAHASAGLGRFEYQGSGWDLPPSPVPKDHPTFASRVFQFGPAARFCADLPAQLLRAANVTLCHSATAVRFRWRRSAVEAVEAVTASGVPLTITARRLILAAGGVENARMLLVEAEAGNVRDESGWLGRGFMEHPRDYSIMLGASVPSRRLEFLDTHVIDGATVCGRIALREDAILREDLPNASVTLLPTGPSLRPFHWRLERLARRRFGVSLQWPPGFGWSRLPRFARHFSGFQVLINFEEFPHPDNRLILDSTTDALGVRRARLQRRWRRADAARHERLRSMIVLGLAEIGLGPLNIGPLAQPDANSHHHMGTTRMGVDARTGVTDANGQVFGTENVFVAGASVFPAAGFANPTLTSIALSLRLAGWLKGGTA